MFCTTGWGSSWMVGGWLIPGLLLVALAVAGFWLMRRHQSPALPHCPHCGNAIEPVYFRCPHCGATLKRNCPGCSRVVEQDWTFCSHCGHPLKPAENRKSSSNSIDSTKKGEQS